MAVRTSCFTRWEKRFRLDAREVADSGEHHGHPHEFGGEPELPHRRLRNPRIGNEGKRVRLLVLEHGVQGDAEHHGRDEREKSGRHARQQFEREPVVVVAAVLGEESIHRPLYPLPQLLRVYLAVAHFVDASEHIDKDT